MVLIMVGKNSQIYFNSYYEGLSRDEISVANTNKQHTNSCLLDIAQPTALENKK